TADAATEARPSQGAPARTPTTAPDPRPQRAAPSEVPPAPQPPNFESHESTLTAPRARRRGKKRKRKPTLADKLEAWRGFVPQPQGPEQSLWRSFLYPLWDFKGVGFLVVGSILWWFLTFVFFSQLNMQVHGEARGGAPLRAIIPSFIGLIVIF